MRVRGAVAWGAAASLLLALSGCSLLDGDDPETEPPSSGPTDGQGEHPSGQPTIPPQLLECGDPAGKGGDSEETEGDDPVELTDALVASDASWDVPAGYESATGYYDDLDYEQRMFMHTYVPTAPGYDTLDLVGVLGYDGLDWGQLAQECGQVPLEAMLERVAEYQDLLDAEPLDEAELTEVGGLPAVTQTMRIPSYDFRGYWLFSQTELLFIGCQWTSQDAQAEIESSCADLVATVQVG